MSFLIDTNILVRSQQINHGEHASVANALAQLPANGYAIHVVPQVLYEFWVVATRPIANRGLGLSVDETALVVTDTLSTFVLKDDAADVFQQWRELVVHHRVSGKPAHDARLVAAMRVHGLTHLLTFNVADFARYNDITVVSPAALLTP